MFSKDFHLARNVKLCLAHQRVDIIEIHKSYDHGREVIEVMDLRKAKPSEILATADGLMDQGAQPTKEQRRAMDSIRQVTYEQA